MVQENDGYVCVACSYNNVPYFSGNFLLHTLPAAKLPATLGGVARSYLIQAMSLSPKRVDIVFGDYPSPSVKDCDRKCRGIDDSQLYAIGGPEQIRRKNFESALSSRSFKQQFPLFLAEEWHDQSYDHIIDARDVYVEIPDYCYHCYVLGGQVVSE